MNTFTTILLVVILLGGAYFAYWAIQKTLEEKSNNKPEKPSKPSKPEGHNNKHHNQRR